ncbi:KH domain-containing protein [Nitriliruptoraceae bacterium ZYF776]|nr:KH domain-containing protein [Profundirhabdus halotolerans]
MSRRTDGQGPSLEQALEDALSGLLDVAADQVTVKVDGPGVGDLEGRLRLDLEVGADEPEDEPSAPAPRVRAGRDKRGPSGDDQADDRDEAPDRDGRETADRDDGERDVVLTAEDLDEEADAAADFLEGLLDALDLPGDIRIRVAEDHAEVEVVEIGSGALIGRRGQTLEAIQELVRCALQREFQRRSRIKVDAEGYRSRRLEKLMEKADEAIDEVLDTGEPVRLEPMDVFERKAVHQLVADVDGVTSRSQGREPARRVVIEQD